MSARSTGDWVVRQTSARGDTWLIGGPFAPGSIRAWLAWGPERDAYVFPTKTAARDALRDGHRRSGITIERARS